MKIYTITCHDVYNLGASLQAYSLAEYLKSLGHQVEIIDYKPNYLSRHYSLSAIGNPKYNKPILRELYLLLKFPSRIKALHSKRKAEFDQFTKERLPLTPRRYISNDDLKANLPKADIYFAGSDQIWNCMFQNGRDPAFYLDFAPNDAVKASYAASFATEDIPDDSKTQIKKWLSRLDSISVRERSGIEIVERLGIDGAERVLDPVFLMPRQYWDKIADPIAYEQPFVLLYDFDCDKDMITTARCLADQNDWKLYSVLPCIECDRCFDQDGPRTFLTLVRDAQFVISNSFHATAFSIIFHKNFAVYKRQEGINTRMIDLLSMVGLENRLIQGRQLNELCDINFNSVDIKLEKELRKSRDYLERVIAL